ncbi:MAG: hypothetical protein NXI16_08380 [Alphaproteobacteria bacterium]|nr:hypothetical protein [Alphaproteobacteria bacterium]
MLHDRADLSSEGNPFDGPFPDLDQILQAASQADDGTAPDWVFEAQVPIKSYLNAQRDSAGAAMIGDFRLVARTAEPTLRAQRTALSTLADVLEDCLGDADRVEQGGPTGLLVLFSAENTESAREITTTVLRRTSKSLRFDREASAFTARGFCFDYAPYLDADDVCDVDSLRRRTEQVVAARMAMRQGANRSGKGDERSFALQFSPIIAPRKRMMLGYATQFVEQVLIDPSNRTATSRRDGDVRATLDTLAALSQALTERDDKPNVLLTLGLSPAILNDADDRSAFEDALFELPHHALRRLFFNVDLSQAVSLDTEMPFVAECLSGRGRGMFFSVPLDFTGFDLAAALGCHALCPVLPRDYSDGARDRATLRRFTEGCRKAGVKAAWFPRNGKQLTGRAILNSKFDMFSYPTLLPPAKAPDPVYRMPQKIRARAKGKPIVIPTKGSVR